MAAFYNKLPLGHLKTNIANPIAISVRKIAIRFFFPKIVQPYNNPLKFLRKHLSLWDTNVSLHFWCSSQGVHLNLIGGFLIIATHLGALNSSDISCCWKWIIGWFSKDVTFSLFHEVTSSPPMSQQERQKLWILSIAAYLCSHSCYIWTNHKWHF